MPAPSTKKTNSISIVVSLSLKDRLFGIWCFCRLPQTGDFDENGENDDFAFFSTHQTNKDFAPQTPENDENGGCHSGQSTVYRKQVNFATVTFNLVGNGVGGTWGSVTV